MKVKAGLLAQAFPRRSKPQLPVLVILFCVASLQVALAQTYTIVYAFNGKNKLTAGTSITRDDAGNLYGASTAGSVAQCYQGPCGAIYKIDGKGKQTIVYSFQGPPDGANPVGVIVTPSGMIYGTTLYGGTSTLQYCGGGCGTVFGISSSGKETVLHSFMEPPKDGILPQAGVIRDAKGVLYGTTTFGGPHIAYGNPGEGTVYKIQGRKRTVIYSFTGGDDGALPAASVLLRDGSLYGTTTFGGSGSCSTLYGAGCGTVFKVKGTKESALYSFNNESDGGFPAGSLISDKSGNLYGTAVLGGDLNCTQPHARAPILRLPGVPIEQNPPGCGTVFKVSPSGVETVLYTFTGTQDGSWPSAALVLDSSGNLYGTAEYAGEASCGGGTGCGTLFKLDTAGKFSVLHTFKGSDGAYPHALIGDKGKLYGTASGEGPYGYGVVYEVAP